MKASIVASALGALLCTLVNAQTSGELVPNEIGVIGSLERRTCARHGLSVALTKLGFFHTVQIMEISTFNVFLLFILALRLM